MDAYKSAVMWYGAGILPAMRKMTRATVQAIAQEASELSGERPLQHIHTKEFVVPSWSPVKLTGVQVIALMVTSLWCLCGEREDIAHPIIETWPIREMIALAGAKEKQVELAIV